jgi:TolA-binding protein
MTVPHSVYRSRIKLLAAFTALVLRAALPLATHAQDLSAWQKDRDAKFAAFKAAHPNQDADIAEIKAKTAALIAAYVPPPAPDKYADLRARSASLTPEQKAQAQGIFATGFKLWQSGDYASAKEAFNEGLTIDPANGMANYYIGDILSRQNAGGQAAVAMDKAGHPRGV